jgi:putative phosphoesterase
MRLAVISDTHMPKGGRALPAGCVRRLRRADAILHAGDLSTAAVLQELRALGPPLHAVHGNVDTPDVQNELPVALELSLAGVTIAMVHDAGPTQGRLARMRGRFPAADAVIFGHSHQPLLERGTDGLQIFNPGSPTERRRAPSHTMGLAHLDGGGIGFEIVALD